MSFAYCIGDTPDGRTIIAIEETGVRPALNVYRVRHSCCGRESSIQEQSLIKSQRERGGKPVLCSSCRRKAACREGGEVIKEVTLPDNPPLFATWPVPPSMRDKDD